MPYQKPSVMPQSEKECISFHLQMLGGGGDPVSQWVKLKARHFSKLQVSSQVIAFF